MDRTRAEASALLDAALTLPAVVGTTPQVAGMTMGGLIAQMVIAEETRYAAAVSVVGHSSFCQADPWCREAQAGSWCDQWSGRYAPQSHPERYTERPLLFIDGGLDTDCPAAINAETVRLANAAGGTAEQFVDAAVGHGFSASMRERYTVWVIAHGPQFRTP